MPGGPEEDGGIPGGVRAEEGRKGVPGGPERRGPEPRSSGVLRTGRSGPEGRPGVPGRPSAASCGFPAVFDAAGQLPFLMRLVSSVTWL